MTDLIFWSLFLLVYLGFSVWLAKGILLAIFHAVSSHGTVEKPAVSPLWTEAHALETSESRLDHSLEL